MQIPGIIGMNKQKKTFMKQKCHLSSLIPSYTHPAIGAFPNFWTYMLSYDPQIWEGSQEQTFPYT